VVCLRGLASQKKTIPTSWKFFGKLRNNVLGNMSQENNGGLVVYTCLQIERINEFSEAILSNKQLEKFLGIMETVLSLCCLFAAILTSVIALQLFLLHAANSSRSKHFATGPSFFPYVCY